MKQSAYILIFAAVITHTYAAPQFITYKDGKIGVNFFGYHAGVGIGGGVNGGAAGGLFAEAGTPHGQTARAGLGGAVDEQGRALGGLYAGAAASPNVKASAGLGGGVYGDKSSGGGFANAQAGNKIATSGLGGLANAEGTAGVSYSSTNKVIAPVNTDVYTEIKYDAQNEIKPNNVQSSVEVKTEVQHPVVVKEVYIESQPKIVEKEIIHYKPRRHHFHKTTYVGGNVYVKPEIEKRIDVAAESSVNIGATNEIQKNSQSGAEAVVTKQITYQRNPSFFQDIFNIPISTLKAVGNFLSNTAANTNVSVQKSASVHTEPDSPHYDQSSIKSSEAHLSVETPSASKFIDDIFAIPINTLGAVNKFLENNVPARKNVQVVDGEGVVTRVRGPGKRRANKHVIVIQEDKTESPQ